MTQHASTTLPGDRADAGTGRRFVAEVLPGWGCEDMVEEAALVTSELVTNAILHAGSAITLTVSATVSFVRIEVGDHNPTAPRPKQHGDLASTGRGLELVDLVASRWGVDQGGGDGGKVVWAELDRPDSGGSGRAAESTDTTSPAEPLHDRTARRDPGPAGGRARFSGRVLSSKVGAERWMAS